MKETISEWFADEIPKGKEKEYFSKEISTEILGKMRDFLRFLILLLAFLIFGTIGVAVFPFIQTTQLVEALFYIVVFGGFIISTIFSIIKYFSFWKFLKKIK